MKLMVADCVMKMPLDMMANASTIMGTPGSRVSHRPASEVPSASKMVRRKPSRGSRRPAMGVTTTPSRYTAKMLPSAPVARW